MKNRLADTPSRGGEGIVTIGNKSGWRGVGWEWVNTINGNGMYKKSVCYKIQTENILYVIKVK